MEKYKKVYDQVTIIGVKYMNHVCGPNVSYKLSAFARIFNVPDFALPLYDAVKVLPNAENGNSKMIDWAKIMNMHFVPGSFPANVFSYKNYFIESDSDHRKWDNDIVMDLLLSYNMEENPNIAPQLRDKLSRKIEHIPFVIINKLNSLTYLAMNYDILGFNKPTTSSGDPMPDEIQNACAETVDGIGYYVSSGNVFISKYKDSPVFKSSCILDALKKKIEEASVYVKE